MISVCMTTYNGASYLSQQIESILPQLGAKDELIICDDGSSDATIQIIESFADPRIRLHRNHFRNHILNFESALQKANGDIIFLADQDDVWFPEKVEVMMKNLQGCDLVCHNMILTDSDLNHPENRLYFSDDPSRKPGFMRNLWHNQYVGCCLAFRSRLLERILPFPKGLITHDTWIGLVADLEGKTRFIPEPLIYMRRHGANASSTGEKSRLKISEMISYRLVLLKGILLNFLFSKKHS